jgi:hypothetical protein
MRSPNTVSSCIITVGWVRPKALSCARQGNGTASPPTGLPDEQDREIVEDNMKVTYDPEVDVLRIVFRDVAIEENDEDETRLDT